MRVVLAQHSSPATPLGLALRLVPAVIFTSIVSAAIAAAIMEYFRLPESAGVYEALRNFCHQLPSRSFFFKTSNLGLCARCMAIYSALAVSALLVLFRPGLRIGPWTLLLLILPCTIDGVTQYMGLRLSTNTLRAVTGALAGLGFGLYLFPIYDFLVRKVLDKKLPVGASAG